MHFYKKHGGYEVGGFYKKRKRFLAYAATYGVCEDDPPYPLCSRGLEVVVGGVCLNVSWPSTKEIPSATKWFWPPYGIGV